MTEEATSIEELTENYLKWSREEATAEQALRAATQRLEHARTMYKLCRSSYIFARNVRDDEDKKRADMARAENE